MNPIVIYTGIWFICVFVYNCGIIRFYPLKWETFGYIYGANIVFVLGCLLGIFFSIFSVKITGNNYKRSWESKQNILRAIILLTSIISAFSIVPDVVNSISIYGFNLLANTSDMYFNEITTSQESALSFSAFIFVTAIYVGIYIVEYGFDKSIYFPFLMFVLFAFSKGSRGTFVIIIFLLLSQITLPGKQRIVSKDSFKKNIKKLFKIFSVFVAIVIAITIVRRSSEDVYYGYLAFDFLSGTVIVSLLGYISSGIGCLNQFFDFPITSDHPILFFRVFYIFFNKLGISDVNTIIHFPTYFTPIPGNVLTYIGELYIDFQNFLFIVVLILATIFSYSFCKVNREDSIFYRTLYAVMFVYFVLSFFASFLHAAGLWYALVFGIFFSFFIDYKIKL
jgi:oligosaccharide repeat unit polymerase